MCLSAFSTSTHMLLMPGKRRTTHLHRWDLVQIHHLQPSLGPQCSFIVPFQLSLSFPLINIPNHHNFLKSLPQPTYSRLLTDHIFSWQQQETEDIRQDLIQFPTPIFTPNKIRFPTGWSCFLLLKAESPICNLTTLSSINFTPENFQISPSVVFFPSLYEHTCTSPTFKNKAEH